MVNSSVAPASEVVCRAFFAPLPVGNGSPTAFIVGVGEGPTDAEYLDALQRDGEGLGATWLGRSAVEVFPLSVDERDRLFQPFFGSGWPGGLRFNGNDTFLEFKEGSELRSTFPNPMRLISVGNGRLYFREGDERGWPAGEVGGPNAFLTGRRSLVLMDLDEAKSQYLLGCASATVSGLSSIAGFDALSEFASRGHAFAFNPEARTDPNAKHFFSAEETTGLLEKERQKMVERTLEDLGDAIPEHKVGSVRTAVKVRAAVSGRTLLGELKTHRGDALRTAASSTLPGFLARLQSIAPVWARGPERRMKRELRRMLDTLYADLKDTQGEGVLQRLLGRGHRNRFLRDESMVSLDSEVGETVALEVSSSQPEVDADPVLSAAEKLEALAAKTPFTRPERDLFESMCRGETMPDWALRRGPRYRMHYSDAKKLWADIKVKIHATVT